MAQSPRVKFDRRLARWKRLHIGMKAEYSFGLIPILCERHKQALAEGSPDASAISNAVDAAEEEVARKWVLPADKAARLLAMTPAPDLAAVEEKIGAIVAEDLVNSTGHSFSDTHWIELVQADIARIVKGA